MGSEQSKSYYDQVIEAIPQGHGYIKPLVIVGASGSGKKTLFNHLKQHYTDQMIKAISVTTRAPHASEINGVDYIFESQSDFKKEQDAGLLFEQASFDGHQYGIHFNFVKNAIANEKICVLDVNLEGAKRIHEISMNFCFVYIQPPSKEVLRARL